MTEVKTNINVLIDKDNPEKCERRCRYNYSSIEKYHCKLFGKTTELNRCDECIKLFGVPEPGLLKANVTIEF